MRPCSMARATSGWAKTLGLVSARRQVFLAALQLEVMQRYPGQAGLERTLRRTEQIDPHLAQARLIVVGLDEGPCAASRHPLPCMPAGSNRGPQGRDADRKCANPRV